MSTSLASTTSTIVVVGGGHAGGEAVAALRMAGHAGRLVLIGAEPYLPYHRPPLSKDYLLGKTDASKLELRPKDFYDQQGVEVLLGTRAVDLDSVGRRITLEDGRTLTYDAAVLATGGVARRLPGAAATAPNVHYIRGIADVERLRPQVRDGARMVVIGGGYVGLEMAGLARSRGLHVTLIEASGRLLARVAGEETAQFLRRVHEEEGVSIRLSAMVAEFEAGDDGAVFAVRLVSGESVPCDVVVVGIGLSPDVELATAAGLVVDDGVVVDEYCRTSVPTVLAIGDCARHPCSEYGGLRRLESVPNATEQARVAASVLTTQSPRAYRSVPWFWSDQYDLRIQSVGLATNYDCTVVRHPVIDVRSIIVFYLLDGQVRAADVVNAPSDFGMVKQLVGRRASARPDQLADPEVSLRELVRQIPR